jgi:hypothetical protein
VIIVSDNSALSCLAELGLLDLLRQLYGTVVITSTIQQEACHPSAPPALRKFITSMPSWLVVQPDIQPYLEETKALDPGEASAITLAWQHRESSLLIIDEKRGRRVSSALGLKITGAAGVLTDAAAAGLVPFEEVFQRLAQTQFRLSAPIVEQLRQRYQSQPPL